MGALVVKLATLLLLAAVTACQPGTEPAQNVGVEADRTDREKAACLARGASWSRVAGTVFTCVEQTGDGGQSCQSSATCKGVCLARSMTCAPVRPLFGCNEILNDSGLRVTMCRE